MCSVYLIQKQDGATREHRPAQLQAANAWHGATCVCVCVCVCVCIQKQDGATREYRPAQLQGANAWHGAVWPSTAQEILVPGAARRVLLYATHVLLMCC